MSNEELIDTQIPESFPSYFRRSRLLHIGLAFNLIYYSAITFAYLFYYSTGQLSSTVFTMDFQVFYDAGGMILISPGDLYTVNPNGLPFRYFPLFSYVFAILHSFPIELLYLFNNAIMMLLNFGIVWVSYYLCLEYGLTPATRNFEKTLLFIFIAPQHIVNLILGQFAQLLILLILLTVLILQRSSFDSMNSYFLVGFFIGIASNLKPFVIILFAFVIPIVKQSRFRFHVSWKSLFGVFAGFLLVMIPSGLFFLVHPESLDGFIRVNFFENLDYHHSTSVTRLLTTMFPILQDPIPKYTLILAMGLLIFFQSYFRFITTPHESRQYVTYFAEMMFLILLIYPDSWFLFLAIWYTMLGPSILLLYTSCELSESGCKRVDFLWSGSNNLLAFFWVGVLLHYLVLGFDPIDPIWLLILYILFIYLTKELSRKSNKH